MSEAGVADAMTAGALLRQARENAGMHIATLAVALKVPVAKLEALEADNHALLPDIVFVRALASSVCRNLKIDPKPVLSLLPVNTTANFEAENAGLNAPVRGGKGPSASLKSSFAAQRSRSMVFAVVALLVAAAAVLFLPASKEGDISAFLGDLFGSFQQHVGDPASTELKYVESVPAPVVAAESPVNTATVASSPAPVDSGGVGPVESPAAGVLAAASVAAIAPAASASAPGGGILVLRARAESWVQVRDASGGVALQRNLAAGESVSLVASTPMAVVIGRADVTEVFVRGEPLNLTNLSRENVARFEVK